MEWIDLIIGFDISQYKYNYVSKLLYMYCVTWINDLRSVLLRFIRLILPMWKYLWTN